MLAPEELVVATLRFIRFPGPTGVYREVYNSWPHRRMCDETNKHPGRFAVLGWGFVSVEMGSMSSSAGAGRSGAPEFAVEGRPTPVPFY